MARLTKAMLEEENKLLRQVCKQRYDEIISLKKEIEALKFPHHVINTMAMTVQHVADTTTNLLQSIPSINRYKNPSPNPRGSGTDERR